MKQETEHRKARGGFITVEDLFGVFVADTAIGYSGLQSFSKAILPEQEGSTAIELNLKKRGAKPWSTRQYMTPLAYRLTDTLHRGVWKP